MVLALLALVVVSLGGVLLYETFLSKEIIEKQTPLKLVSTKEQNQSFVTSKLKILPQEKTDILTIATEIEDYVNSQKHQEKNITKPLLQSACKTLPKTLKPQRRVYHDNMPRLAIIMDDIGNIVQVRKLQKVPFAITPSIFPATTRHPNTPQFAKMFRTYMVHMPMEAFHFLRPEENTLKVEDSQLQIEEKIASMYQDFPDAIAINNHTGSKFTSNAQAMDRLFYVLDKYNITFIDSKTAPHTLGKEVGALHHKIILERHIFLDNEPDVVYILNQLKKAVRYAKKHGIAIAICHPRAETFEAFKRADEIIKDVKVVTIDALYD